MFDTPWAGSQNNKLYLQSGQFTSTLKRSEDINAIDTNITGIEWDSINTPWVGDQANKLYLQSGQFTSTLKYSQDVTSIEVRPMDISSDRNNTPWIGLFDDKLYLQSGQFTSTLKRSQNCPDAFPTGISWDGTNTPWCGAQFPRLILQSGQFSSTLKMWVYVGGIDTTPIGVSWDGTNTPWIGNQAKKLYLQSGQFTSTLKRSEYVGGIDDEPNGISTSDYDGRMGTIIENTIDTLTLSDEIINTNIFNRIIINTITLTETYVLTNEHTTECTEIDHWARWVLASTSNYFATIVENAGYPFFIEGADYEEQKFIEFRMDGPDITQLNPYYFRLDVDINLLWSFIQGHKDLHQPARIKGILMQAFDDICIYRFGDDESQLGILKLKNPVRVNNFGMVNPETKLMQGTVEGTFEMHLSCH